MIFIYISLMIFALVLIIVYNIYVLLKTKKINFEEAKSGVDIQLKKRFDLIPNILSMIKKYMNYENDVLAKIVELRNIAIKSNDIVEKNNLENEINTNMKNLILSFENYPELKADSLMNNAIITYNEIEEYISASRRFYNSALSDFKKYAEIFPCSFFANIFNIHINDKFFEINENERQSINAKDWL